LKPLAIELNSELMTYRTALGLVFLALLTACAAGGGTGGVVATNVDYYPLYKPSLIQWVGDSRDVPVIVFGNPTPAPPDVWNVSVTDAMNRSSWIKVGNFTTTPDGTERGNFHFALAFNATSTMTGAMACSGNIDLAQLAPVNGRTAIVGAFCNNDRVVTTARVTVNAIMAANSPQLQPAMNQMLIKLLPRQDPNRPDRFGTPFFFN
jgi:hypothetical protein